MDTDGTTQTQHELDTQATEGDHWLMLGKASAQAFERYAIRSRQRPESRETEENEIGFAAQQGAPSRKRRGADWPDDVTMRTGPVREDFQNTEKM